MAWWVKGDEARAERDFAEFARLRQIPRQSLDATRKQIKQQLPIKE
jgi:hypothetical protein